MKATSKRKVFRSGSVLLARTTRLLLFAALFVLPSAARAVPSITLPLAPGFSNGERIFLVRTEASDAAVASQSGVTLVPRLTNLIAANATSKAYQVTNFTQP